jgi:hypothetical protein
LKIIDSSLRIDDCIYPGISKGVGTEILTIERASGDKDQTYRSSAMDFL